MIPSLNYSTQSGVSGATNSGASSGGPSIDDMNAATAGLSGGLDRYFVPILGVVLVVAVLALVRQK